jgi:hypothetical protein
MAFYYIPQNAWGLVEQAYYEAAGFYSGQGGGCRPVVLWCALAQRGGYTHFDGNAQAVNEPLVDWFANGDDANVISIYTNDAEYAENIRAQILATGFYGENEDGVVIVEGSNPEGYWGCAFTEAGPNWLNANEIDGVPTPPEWSEYWNGAPEWVSNGSFNNAITDQLKGFIANYNGKFYFDFTPFDD